MLQKFSFQVVTREGKSMKGYITAETIEVARAKLSASGMSILDLAVAQEGSQRKEGIHLFEFQGITPDHQSVKGTVEALDDYAAYKKLCTEYQLDLNYLLPADLSPEEKVAKQQSGIDPVLKNRLDEENKNVKDNVGVKVNVNETEQILDAQKKEMEYIQDKVGLIIKDVKSLLDSGGEYLKTDKKREIEERLDLLARLRNSNSIGHLKTLALETIQDLTKDALFLEEEQIRNEDHDAWLARKSEFQKFGVDYEKNINKGLAEIQSLFANIDPEKLKKIADQVRNINPVRKFFNTLFYTFCILFVLCSAFWVWILIGMKPELSSFYIHSGPLWYITFISSVIAGVVWFVMRLSEDASTLKLCGLGAGAVLIVLLASFEFNLIFFWI